MPAAHRIIGDRHRPLGTLQTGLLECDVPTRSVGTSFLGSSGSHQLFSGTEEFVVDTVGRNTRKRQLSDERPEERLGAAEEHIRIHKRRVRHEPCHRYVSLREALGAFMAVLDRYTLADILERKVDLRGLFGGARTLETTIRQVAETENLGGQVTKRA